MRRTVLILDDDPAMLRSWQRTARLLEVDTSLCSTAEEALEALQAGPVDALASDFHLARGNSLPVIRAATERSLPVVVVTGDPLTAAAECARAGLCVRVLGRTDSAAAPSASASRAPPRPSAAAS